MYTICNTSQDDVLSAVKAIKKENRLWPIFQIGQRSYRRLDKTRENIRETLDARNAKHIINLSTETVHKKECQVLKRTTNACKLGAYLINIPATGLKICKVCG